MSNMLGKLSVAGQNAQFRTPKHIRDMMVRLLAPTPDDRICEIDYSEFDTKPLQRGASCLTRVQTYRRCEKMSKKINRHFCVDTEKVPVVEKYECIKTYKSDGMM